MNEDRVIIISGEESTDVLRAHHSLHASKKKRDPRGPENYGVDHHAAQPLHSPQPSLREQPGRKGVAGVKVLGAENGSSVLRSSCW